MLTEAIKLSAIRRHVAYHPYVDCLSQADYLLKNPGLLTVAAVRSLQYVLPVTVVRIRNNYHYISGHRTYTLAMAVLDCESEIPVNLLNKPKRQVIRECVLADVLLTLLVVPAKQKTQIGRLLKAASCSSPELLDHMFVHTTQECFAKSLNCSKNTIFLKKEESHGS